MIPQMAILSAGTASSRRSHTSLDLAAEGGCEEVEDPALGAAEECHVFAEKVDAREVSSL